MALNHTTRCLQLVGCLRNDRHSHMMPPVAEEDDDEEDEEDTDDDDGCAANQARLIGTSGKVALPGFSRCQSRSFNLLTVVKHAPLGLSCCRSAALALFAHACSGDRSPLLVLRRGMAAVMTLTMSSSCLQATAPL